jgi:hypothetical protein
MMVYGHLRHPDGPGAGAWSIRMNGRPFNSKGAPGSNIDKILMLSGWIHTAP